jgi:regulator of replication initiation timing
VNKLTDKEQLNATPAASPVMQHIGLLNIRINDMMTQLNAVMKAMMDENAALKKENAELKTKQEKTNKH